MAFHADRREARSQQPPGQGSEFNATRKSSPRPEDGWLTGLGTAPALHDVPALERSHARRPAARWARSCLRPEAPIVPEITLDRAPTAARPAPRLTVRIR